MSELLTGRGGRYLSCSGTETVMMNRWPNDTYIKLTPIRGTLAVPRITPNHGPSYLPLCL